MPRKIEINKWDKYNRLTIIKEVKQIWYRRMVECKCDCWNIKEFQLSSIRTWHTKSCWCAYKEWNSTHWMNWTKIYNVRLAIPQRCNNPKVKAYKNYWWRWIKCEWDSFEEFYKDMWKTYKEWLQIDRINNNWNYCKENCRWVTVKQNARNKRSNIIYKWKCLIEYCEESWLNYRKVLQQRYRWKTINEAILILKWS